jgi:hypothetical protein
MALVLLPVIHRSLNYLECWSHVGDRIASGVEYRKCAVDADEPDVDARVPSDPSPQDLLGYTDT